MKVGCQGKDVPGVPMIWNSKVLVCLALVFLLVLKAIGTLKDGGRPSSSKLRLLSLALSFMGHPCVGTERSFMPVFPGKTLFLSRHKLDSLSGKCARVGYHCRLDTA